MNTSDKISSFTLLFSLIVGSVMLGGCIGSEPGDEPESMTEAEPGDGSEATTEAEPTAQAASALLSSWDEQMFTDDNFPGGRVRFETNGDVVEVCDIQADGKAVDLRVRRGSNTIYTVHVGGEGNCETRRASLGHEYDLVEGAVYEFRICLNGNEWCDTAFWKNEN